MSPKRDYPKKNASYYDAVQKSIYTFSDLIKPLYKEEFGMIPLETCYVVMFGEFWPEPFCSQDCINVRKGNIFLVLDQSRMAEPVQINGDSPTWIN